MPDLHPSPLLQALQQGLVTVGSIEQALGRVLGVRFRLGHMDPPDVVPFSNITADVINSPAHRALAADAAAQGIVLLTNPTGCLPLAMSELQSLAVVGPNANVSAFGNYAGTNSNYSTMLSGIRTLFPAATYARGCNISDQDTSGFVAAVKAAEAAEVTVAVMGIDQSQEHETGTRSDIILPGVQNKLLTVLRRAAKRLVVLLVGGSAMAVPYAKAHADALLWIGYGGEEAGVAAARVIFGHVSPSGKLPMTWYTGLEQLPPFSHMQMNEAPGRTYRYLTQEPLFRFGFGLSYGRFQYETLHLSSSTISVCDSINASVVVRNVGGRQSVEVVQLYVSLKGTTSAAPHYSLQGFERVNLMPRESQTVQFSVDARGLAVVDPLNRRGWMVEPAEVQVLVGGVSPPYSDELSTWAGLQQTVAMKGTARSLISCTKSVQDDRPTEATAELPTEQAAPFQSDQAGSIFIPALNTTANLTVSPPVPLGKAPQAGMEFVVPFTQGSLMVPLHTGLAFSNDRGSSFKQLKGDIKLRSNVVPGSTQLSVHDFGSAASDLNSNISQRFSLTNDSVVVSPGPAVRITGLPHKLSCSMQLQSVVVFGDGTLLQSAAVCWDGRNATIVLASKDGVSWAFRGVVAEEVATITLSMVDFGQVLAVVSLADHSTYYTFTRDGGYTWSALNSTGTRSLQASLLVLGDGYAPLLMAGGYREPVLYVDWGGAVGFPMPVPVFQPVSLSWLHNTLATAQDPKFTAQVNSSTGAEETSSRMALAAVDRCSAVLVYDCRGAAFAMHLQFHIDHGGETGVHC